MYHRRHIETTVLIPCHQFRPSQLIWRFKRKILFSEVPTLKDSRGCLPGACTTHDIPHKLAIKMIGFQPSSLNMAVVRVNCPYNACNYVSCSLICGVRGLQCKTIHSLTPFDNIWVWVSTTAFYIYPKSKEQIGNLFDISAIMPNTIHIYI